MLKKIKIAYIFENNKNQGGNFVTEISTAKRLLNLKKDNLEIYFYSSNKKNLESLRYYDIKAKFIKLSQPNLFLMGLYKSVRNKIVKTLLNLIFQFDFLERKLLDDKIDIVHFNGMSSLAILLNKINFGVTFWDCGHIEHPEFPESKENYLDLENRETLYNLILKKSSYIITDCEENLENIDRYYRVNKDKIFKIYSEPSQGILLNIDKNNNESSTELLNKYEISKKNYLFYPAQLWPHKNHVYILEAINLLKTDHKKNLDIVFVGNNRFNNLGNIEKKVEELKLKENLKLIKFVDDQTLYQLYKNSFAIVVPTYFGPTNHLPVEAFCLGIPVFYSNIHSHNEQVSGAVVEIDLNNPKDLAYKINEMLENNELRENMIKKGYDKYKNLKNKILNNEKTFYKIFQNFEVKRKNWN